MNELTNHGLLYSTLWTELCSPQIYILKPSVIDLKIGPLKDNMDQRRSWRWGTGCEITASLLSPPFEDRERRQLSASQALQNPTTMAPWSWTSKTVRKYISVV